MRNDDDLKLVEAKLLEAMNLLYEVRARGSAARDPWVPVKVAAHDIGMSVRATWTRAQNIPGCSRMYGKRRQVNLDLIQHAIVVPPTARQG
jgi:hypothetical protein